MARTTMANWKRLAAIVIGLCILVAAPLALLHPAVPRANPPAPSTVSPATPTPTPSIAEDPTPAKQTGKVRLTAKGFSPGELVTFKATVQSDDAKRPRNAPGTSDDTRNLGQARADRNGIAVASEVTLPEEIASGAHAIEAVGTSGGHQATGTLFVRAKSPWMTLGNYSVKPGGTVGMIFGGIQPNGDVAISLEPAAHRPNGQSQDPTTLSPPVQVGKARTDQVGNATWTDVHVPLLRPGAYSVVAQAGDRATADLVVIALTPVVELSPWSGPPGAQITLNARGFAANDRVQVFVDRSTQPALGLTADQSGNFWGAGPLRAPIRSGGGALPIRVVGLDSGAEANVAFQVQNTKPWLELTSWSGPPGSPVSFGGGGWAAGEKVTVHLGSDSGPVVSESLADDYGWLRTGAAAAASGSSDPGESATQTVTFVATGEQSHASASATFTVVNPFAGTPRDLPRNPLP